MHLTLLNHVVKMVTVVNFMLYILLQFKENVKVGRRVENMALGGKGNYILALLLTNWGLLSNPLRLISELSE
jgi:hypothetical protein